MKAEIKYAGLGLVIGGLIGVLLLTLMVKFATSNTTPDTEPTGSPTSPAPTGTLPAFPSQTATSSPTARLPILRTPRLTATVDPIQGMIQSGQLTFSGPLSDAQQTNLYETSLNYLAPTSEQSLLLSKELNKVSYGNPSNTCGPLAVAILQDAGLLPPYIQPHEFWLLDPTREIDREVLNRTFPPDRYEDTRFKTPLNEFDWKSFPLLPGDFVYIYHGTGGNFDHMLVVNRVDNRGRAYSVTNIHTADGFIFSEVILYDPAYPEVGMFRVWTDSYYAILGSTGFGGFEVWRLKQQPAMGN